MSENFDIDELEDGVFHVWQPNSVDIFKSDTTAKVDPKSWKIAGHASTAHRDRQDEQVMQKGLDFAEFVQFGWFNDNHQQHTSAAIGVPEEASLKTDGWFVKGYLLQKVPRAQEIYTLAKALTGTGRKLGFSIEGKILDRVGSRIVKALIRNVAVTNCPVNTSCVWDLVAKSWASDIEMKALSLTDTRTPKEGGDTMRVQQLERDEVKYLYQCPTCKKAFKSTAGLENHFAKNNKHADKDAAPDTIQRTVKSFTPDEAMAYIQATRPEWSESVAKRLVSHLLKNINP